MKALVTGATGFVGSAVARALLREGWQVRVLCRKSSDRRNIAALAVEVCEGDLNAKQTLAAAVAGCEALFHVAADYRLGARNPEQLYQTNIEGTRNILTACAAAGVGRIVYTSSVATMGIPADGSPGNETTPVSLSDMIGHYKRSKFLAEQLVLEAAQAGTPIVIVNPSTPVGPGDLKPTPTGQLVFDAAAGRTPAYVDTGLNIAHVDDVANGHLLALHHGRSGERYILGGDDMSLRDILTEIAHLVGRRGPHIKLPHAAVMPIAYLAEFVAAITGRPTRITVEGVRMSSKRMFFSSEKATRELGYSWRPATQALRDAIDWMRRQGLLPPGTAPLPSDHRS